MKVLRQTRRICIAVVLALVGCSSDNPPPENKGADKTAANPKQNQSGPAASGQKALPQPEADSHEPKAPTRSELRVMAEQARLDEEKAGNYIERFNDNLANPQARQEVQDQFKKMLPEYKERMLQLGKAQLKQAKP